ncbi:tRNA-dihydrouridine(47) synthase [NAD(P)(+)]-like [Acipenser ruthenus]|uniref:tRNA-dihydrouridine(47) synthase [NAD(P)(+)]-like n=1 Tax=Acipenser ruthenus TaxID=7906 RepID=A0A444TZM5_ACIRT|nr:tRNA-dihydrouridine(47) synthase [NAD(P)(+)]-like [Acipenser ruthenus]
MIGVLERLLQGEKEVFCEAGGPSASSGEGCLPVAERTGPGWIPKSAAPENQNIEGRAEHWASQPNSGAVMMGWQTAELPSFDGTTSCWIEEDKAQQLTTALRGDAQMVLLKEMGRYCTLVAALQRQFGSTGEPNLLRARFRRREWAAGESLARLVTDLEREVRRLYADAAAREQEEQARFQFVEDMGSGELRKVALIKPWIFTEIKEQRHWDILSSERLDNLKDFTNFGLEHWGSDTLGVEKTRKFMFEWLSFLYRYILVGLLVRVPRRLNERPLFYLGRDYLESLMASHNVGDWIKISFVGLCGKLNLIVTVLDTTSATSTSFYG